MQLVIQVSADPFETILIFSCRTEDVHVVFFIVLKLFFSLILAFLHRLFFYL